MRGRTPSSKQLSEAPGHKHPQAQSQHLEDSPGADTMGWQEGRLHQTCVCTHVTLPQAHAELRCKHLRSQSAFRKGHSRWAPDSQGAGKTLLSAIKLSWRRGRAWLANLGPEPPREGHRPGHTASCAPAPARALVWYDPKGESGLGRSPPAPASWGRGRTRSQRNHRGSSPA